MAPNMYIMGVQKGGTTYMSLLLNLHEEFHLGHCPQTGGQTKEMHFWEQLGMTAEHVEQFASSWAYLAEEVDTPRRA